MPKAWDWRECLHTADLGMKTTQGLIRRLDEGGYLASGTTRLSPVTTPEQKKTMSEMYYDPLAYVTGFVSTSVGSHCRCHPTIHRKHLLF